MTAWALPLRLLDARPAAASLAAQACATPRWRAMPRHYYFREATSMPGAHWLAASFHATLITPLPHARRTRRDDY